VRIGFLMWNYDYNMASSRMRGYNIIKILNDDNNIAEVYNPDNEYDCLVFIKACSQKDLELIKTFNGIKILDLCDNLLEYSSNISSSTVDICREMAKYATCITVASEKMGEYAKKYNSHVWYIPDALDNIYEPFKILWFGLNHNWKTIQQYATTLMWIKKRYNFEIYAISDWSKAKELPYIDSVKINCIEWDKDIYKDFGRYNVLFSPKMRTDLQWEECKSDNKVVIALKQGLPSLCSSIPEYKKIERLFPNKVKCFSNINELEEILISYIEEYDRIQSYHSNEYIKSIWKRLLDSKGKNNIKLSVITPVYNGEKYISETIDSILNQTYTDFEYIIIDDCSTDSTIDIINKYAKKDDRIKVIFNNINCGHVKSRNIAMKEMKGNVIVPIDADDVAPLDKLETVLTHFKDCDILYGGYFYLNGKKYFSPQPFNVSKLYDQNLINHNAVAFRRGIFYDDTIRYAGDYALWLKCMNLGKRFKSIDVPMIYYRGHSDNITSTKKEEIKKSISEFKHRYDDILEPKISIIMSTYNRKHIICKSIESVLSQSFNNWELIIVNDGGEDISGVVKTFRDSRIKYYNKEHKGLSHSLNYGINKAKCVFIALLDDDDIWESNHLTELYNNIGNTDIIYSNCCKKDRRDNTIYVYDNDFNKFTLMSMNFITTCSVLFRKDVWEKIGGFDESLNTHMDWDFWKRAAIMNFSFKHIPIITCYYIYHGGNMMLNNVDSNMVDMRLVQSRS
jgi:glycosyltransferase involved in cell wall biosynthesis